MLNCIKNKWLKYKIDNASLLIQDDVEHPFQFTTSFMKKHPEYEDEDDVEDLIKEYKAFMYLAATSGEECTPSKAVDEIWHHHILHTKDYLDHWCKDIIGKVIHHNPEKLGDTKDYATQFANTNKNLGILKKSVIIKKKTPSHLSSKSSDLEDVLVTNTENLGDIANMLILNTILDNNSHESTPHHDSSPASDSSSSHSSHSSCSSSPSSCSSSSGSSCSSSPSSCSSSSGSSCSSSSCGGGGGD
jgi:hypothetical protein